jgi:flagellar basal-body rod protein FlgB
VSQVYLLELASQRSQWLSTRQSLIAGNVANANTPQYRA